MSVVYVVGILAGTQPPPQEQRRLKKKKEVGGK